MASRPRIPISQDFVDLCTDTICEFGAVRYSSFSHFIQIMSDLSKEQAEKVIGKLVINKLVFMGQYAKAPVIKAEDELKPDPKALDAFEAYLYILENEKEDPDEPYANKALFPLDFTIGAMREGKSLTYNVFVYDPRNMSQKVSIYDRKYKEDEDHVILLVFPSGINLENAEVPNIKGKYRYAVVRKSKDGLKVKCQMTGIQGE